MKKTLCLLLAAVLLAAMLPATSLAASPTFTLMVYLCGTDLESDGGLATADLKEMVASGVQSGGKLTVYVQTGGTKKWTNPKIKDREAERWTLSEDGLTRADKLGRVDMGDGETFADFLRFGLENYPADRYGVILWDHGAGASDGVCYDELTGNSLNMREIYDAFTKASAEPAFRKFSLVGFDACLMADYEMAVHLAPFAETMVASEETEPGEGWSYKGWLPALAKDTGIDMHALGKKIVDSFIRSVQNAGYGDFGTLSVIDLTKLDTLRAAVEQMAGSLTGELNGGNFNAISRIRQKARSFGETSDAASDMIDLSVFADIFGRFDEAAAAELKAALESTIVYNGYTRNLSNISGLAVLVPYSTRGDADAYLPAYDTQNLMPSYTGFVRSFLGQMGSGSHTFGSSTVGTQSVQDATIDWFSQFATDQSSYYDAYNELWGNATGDSGQSGGDSSQSGDGGNVSGNAEAGDAGSSGGSSGGGSSGDFSLDGFLSSLFGSSDANFNTDAYSAEAQQGASGDQANGSVSSSSFANLWSDQPETQPATVEVSTDGQTYAVDNPFAGATGDYAYTVTLSAEDMQYLATAEANLMMDVSDPDFVCYLDLGYTQDTIIDWNQNKIYGLFDGTWPTLAGQLVSIQDQIANDTYVRSLIPVTLNGEETYLLVVFDKDNPGGVVVGATEGFNDAGQAVRGYDLLKEGDIVVPQYDLIYWDANDEQQTETTEGDPITVGKDGSIPFAYEAVETGEDYVYGFCLNDVYGEYQFTDFTTLSF